MGRISKYKQIQRKRTLDRFFGEAFYKIINSKYFSYNSIIDENNIFVRSNNVTLVINNDGTSASYVMAVDKNRAIYLKTSQFIKVRVHDEINQIDYASTIVHVNREKFKPYYFKEDFVNMHFEQMDTFERLYNRALAQENEKVRIEF